MFIWTIYKNPLWSQAPYVCAEWVLGVGEDGKPAAVPFLHEKESLQEARAIVPAGRTWQNRQDSDEPAQLETWL